MPKKITVTPETTTGLDSETFTLPDAIYAEAEQQAIAEGYQDLNACVKAYVKLLVRARRENQKRQEVNTSDLEAL